MKKRIFALLILFCLTISMFTGCFEVNPPDNSDDNNKDEENNNFTEVSDEEWKSWLSGSKVENVDNYTIIMRQNGGIWGESGYLNVIAKYDVKGDRMQASVIECKYDYEKEDYIATENFYDGNVPKDISDSVEDLTESIKEYKDLKSAFAYDKNTGYYEMSEMGLSAKLGFSDDGFTFYFDMGTGFTMNLILTNINQTVF